VVEADPQESDLTPCGESDRNKVAALVPVQYADDLNTVAAAMADWRDRAALRRGLDDAADGVEPVGRMHRITPSPLVVGAVVCVCAQCNAIAW
jgi:hypothetical protein